MELQYRGYEIRVTQNGDGWSVWAHPLRPDLPITGQYCFKVDASSETEALSEVERQIDELLEPD